MIEENPNSQIGPSTYAGVHDELQALRQVARREGTPAIKQAIFPTTPALRCPGCDGIGRCKSRRAVSARRQHSLPRLPRLRYARAAYGVKLMNKAGENASLPELMDMDVNSAIEFCADRKTVSQKLGILKQLGLGYLTLGENAEPVRRRGTAIKARQRDRPHADRLCLRLR